MKYVICKCGGDMTTMFVSKPFVIAPGKRIHPDWYYRCTETGCNNIEPIGLPEIYDFPTVREMAKHPEFVGAHHFHRCNKSFEISANRKELVGGGFEIVYCHNWTTGHARSYCPACQRKVAATQESRKEEYASSTSHTERGRLGA